MKILLITSSARGHALAEALARSRHKPEIINICPNRNPGLLQIASEQHVMNIMDFPKVLDIAKKTKPDFAVIGPDDPIGNGLADELEKIGIPSMAPKKMLARVESSKGFTRELLQKHNIDASPKFKVFFRKNKNSAEPHNERKELYNFIDQDLEGNYVVKYDALKGGKGVKVSGEHLNSIEEGIDYALECLDECGRVVIEEKLIGVEFSLLSFVTGKTVIDMPAVQDHKRAYEGDTGPNTGGMGTYTDANHSLPFLTAADLKRAHEINQLSAEALMKECNEPYKGILYGGFIAVKDGVRLIEFNARFGDPEALNILPLLETDFVDVCLGIISGELKESDVSFAKKATVCKYIVPKSYPEKKEEKGQVVSFPSSIPNNARMYYGDIAQDEDGTLRLGGSRSAGIVGIADTIREAEKIAESICAQVKGPVRYRADIGKDSTIGQRISTITSLRRS
jgi:phosphoribosylamine--glycine ligase